METTIAFVLGMSVAVVIGLAIVAVIGFVKAIKTEKALNEQMKAVSLEIDMRITNIERMLHEITAEINRRIDDKIRDDEEERKALQRRINECEEHAHKRMDDILSQMDSRFDKASNSNTQSQHHLEKYVESLINGVNTKVNNIILKLKD